MTKMRRVTVAIPAEMEQRILQLKKTDCFVRCSYSEIVRQILWSGISDMEKNKKERFV